MPVLARLPAWVWLGAWVLAFVAGTVNIVGLLGFQHQAITHLTGNSSLLAAAIVNSDPGGATSLGLLMASFVAGAFLSGCIIQDDTLRLGRRYGLALAIVSALLVVAAHELAAGHIGGMYAAACACGLQNAMASTYSGSVVRTTHVSGMFTDLGIAIGHVARRLPVDSRRLKLCATVITGFLAGGVAGASTFHQFGMATLYLPAAITGTIALLYAIYRVTRQTTA
jgi:uncharacterized membrane protein YoaK (UPF0700 family)